MIEPWETEIERAIAKERARCAAAVRKYLSPRAGIFLTRHPGEALQEIIKAIEAGPDAAA